MKTSDVDDMILETIESLRKHKLVDLDWNLSVWQQQVARTKLVREMRRRDRRRSKRESKPRGGRRVAGVALHGRPEATEAGDHPGGSETCPS